MKYLKNLGSHWLFLLLGIFFAIQGSVFTVDERELALKFRFKRLVSQDYQPGLHLKMPLVESVVKFDNRILSLSSPREEFLTSEKKNLVVDFFVKWQIVDAPLFYRAMNQSRSKVISPQAFEETGARVLLPSVKNALSTEFRNRTVQEVVSTQRDALMSDILSKAGAEAEAKGLRVVDVRVKRIDLPDEVSDRVFNRMRQERNRVAKQLRAEGDEEAQRIRAEAERDRTVSLAEAYRDAEKIRGEGDADSARIYAQAYNKDPEFYSFYRSLQAYRASFGQASDVLVLDPNSDFFKYFEHPRSSR